MIGMKLGEVGTDPNRVITIYERVEPNQGVT
jgi:hypothetical protein